MIRRLLRTWSSRGADAQAVAFRDDPASPWLISFPRTGSHWLRMILERATDRPLLPRSFFGHDNQRYLLNHSHDYEFKLRPRRLIYLYRDPVPTVFSQIKFHQVDPQDRPHVELWADLYRLHLRHWLLPAHPDRTVVTYEELATDAARVAARVLHALGEEVDRDRIAQATDQVDRATAVSHTQHDQRIVNTQEDYAVQRQRFTQQHGAMIRDRVIDQGQLHTFFAHLQQTDSEAA